MNPRTAFPIRLLLAAAALSATACIGLTEPGDPDPGEVPALPDQAYVFAVTSDYATGSYAAYGLGSGTRLPNIEANESDAAVRFRGGSDIFVLNRLGRDNLKVLDRKSLKVVMGVKFPALSNPYDVEAKDGLLYVCFLAYDSILVYDQATGDQVGGIDIHAYADSDGHAEAAALAFAGDDLYAIVQNLDIRDFRYAPLADPKLLKIDVKKRAVAKAIALPLTNPLGLTYDTAAKKLYVPCMGEYTDETKLPKLDGGIVVADPATDSADVFITEETLGGNVGKLAVLDGKLFFDVGMAKADRVVALSLADKSVSPIVDLDPFTVGGIAPDAGTNTLCVGDREKGLRLFRLDTYQEKDTSKIDLGLPPLDLVVIR